MTPEEQNIKEKIDGLSDLDVFFNDTKLWERLEPRLEQSKARKQKAVWLWAAACLAITGLSFYFYLLPVDKQQKIYAVTPPPAKSNTTITKEKPAPLKQKVNKLQRVALPKPETKKENVEIEETNERLMLTDLNYLKTTGKLSMLPSAKDTVQYAITYKAQRVTTLNLPVIPGEMMKRETFAKRAFRQIKSFNTEGKIDWRELNIEPRNVWAYLGKSFIVDTSQIKTPKHIKK
ncbi:hypothetical protein [Emticicia sp. TH156]|uniref:hypothetical protein n=1 Tax=Emticicia sp. TH156 TaxID=2067454 RepID=UPI000C77E759|nr:hypothetical protein [Emticicia sp. TH156]PLK43143.1 hypothetical protein C0V77_17350 [Emticicia sp. TH156]